MSRSGSSRSARFLWGLTVVSSSASRDACLRSQESVDRRKVLPRLCFISQYA